VQCVANAARHLTDDGVLVVENVVPDPMYGLRQDRDGFDQYVDRAHIRIGADGIGLGPLALRYVWPSELDLMARLAGLRLRERHGGWSGEPFDGRSLRHVSVYQRG
jgi:hypothetical protein